MTAISPARPRRWVHVLAVGLPALLIINSATGLLPPWTVTAPWIWQIFTSPGAALAPPGESLFVIAGQVSVVFFLAGYAAYVLHTRTPCPWCAEKLPLDPAAAAARYLPALRLSHRGLVPIAVLAAMLMVFVLPQGLPEDVWFFLTSAVWAAYIWSTTKHSELQPWCPWCRDFGDTEEAPEPVPTPSASR